MGEVSGGEGEEWVGRPDRPAGDTTLIVQAGPICEHLGGWIVTVEVLESVLSVLGFLSIRPECPVRPRPRRPVPPRPGLAQPARPTSPFRKTDSPQFVPVRRLSRSAASVTIA